MTTARTAQRPPELAGQTVVVIGGSAGIGLETARRARSEGADVDPDRTQFRAPATRRGRTRRAKHRGVRRHRSGRPRAVLPRPADADRPRDGDGRPTALRAAWPTSMSHRRAAHSTSSPAGCPSMSRGTPSARCGRAARSVHGRHGRSPSGTRPDARLDRHRRAARPHRQPGARARADPGQPHRAPASSTRRCRPHCSATSSTSDATSSAPRCPSGGSSGRPTSPRSPYT